METQLIGDLIKSKLYSAPVKISDMDWQARALKAEARLEALELVSLYANDIVKIWPNFTLRMVSSMTEKINTLKQAIERAKE